MTKHNDNQIHAHKTMTKHNDNQIHAHKTMKKHAHKLTTKQDHNNNYKIST